MTELLLDHPIATLIVTLCVIGAVWIYFEIKNAPNIDDWD